MSILYEDENLKLHLVNGGNFRLDGGAMFGVVPKVMWEKLIEVNDNNQIPMATNSLIISFKQDRRNILIDTGCGDKYTEKEKKIYQFEEKTILDAVKEEGFSPEDITDVILTHLHFDHTGGSTILKGEEAVPAFPNANYYINSDQWEHAQNPNERDRASYYSWNFLPLMEYGVVILLEGETEIADGVVVMPTEGHTPGHQSVLITTSKGEKFFYAGDLLPTSRHIPLPYIMAYDLYPVTTLKVKKDILLKALNEDWTIIFEHDYDTPVGRVIVNKKGKFALRRE